jgi:hypothetical protein
VNCPKLVAGRNQSANLFIETGNLGRRHIAVHLYRNVNLFPTGERNQHTRVRWVGGVNADNHIPGVRNLVGTV